MPKFIKNVSKSYEICILMLNPPVCPNLIRNNIGKTLYIKSVYTVKDMSLVLT